MLLIYLPWLPVNIRRKESPDCTAAACPAKAGTLYPPPNVRLKAGVRAGRRRVRCGSAQDGSPVKDGGAQDGGGTARKSVLERKKTAAGRSEKAFWKEDSSRPGRAPTTVREARRGSRRRVEAVRAGDPGARTCLRNEAGGDILIRLRCIFLILLRSGHIRFFENK